METKRELLISKGWIQAVALVGLCGFLLLGILAYRTYTDEPPIPSKVIGANGELLFTGEDVLAGQEVFLKNGLMEYGSIKQLTAFFSWSAWTASALRPNLDYSYTNNWPPEPLERAFLNCVARSARRMRSR